MKFNLSISRNSHNRVGITVKCKTSRQAFLKLDLSLEEYAEVITGLSHVEVEGVVNGMNLVGKEKIVESRTVRVDETIGFQGKELVADWLSRNCKEEGWELDTYLGSQKSIVYDHTNKNYTINYSVYKYVNSTPEVA